MKIIKRKNGGYKLILTRTELDSVKNSLASFRSGSAVDYMNNARLDFYVQASNALNHMGTTASNKLWINLFLAQTTYDKDYREVSKNIVNNSKYRKYINETFLLSDSDKI